MEYTLSAEAKTLIPVIAVMHKLGVNHLVRRSILRKMGIPPRRILKPPQTHSLQRFIADDG